MAAAKNTPKTKVVITFRNPDYERPSIVVGTNNIFEDGKRVLKQYRIKPGEEVEIPKTVVDLLKSRYYVIKKNGKNVREPMYFIEKAGANS